MNTGAAGLVVAVCTGRLEDLRSRWKHNISHLAGDEFLVLFDDEESAEAAALAEEIRACGGLVIFHGGRRGLSAARNSVLSARPDRRILYIDDDVLLDRVAVDTIRTAFSEGAHIVGARLVPPPGMTNWPWYFTAGQMHLVGWHTPDGAIKTWGGCMGIDGTFAQQHRLRFDMRLGRTGRRLESGDDTSFVAAMKAAGARETLLPSVHVVHDVDRRRLTIAYLARRAYWQGRSEARRNQALAGLRKEWGRYRQGGRFLALAYTTAVAVGVVREWVATGRSV